MVRPFPSMARKGRSVVIKDFLSSPRLSYSLLVPADRAPSLNVRGNAKLHALSLSRHDPAGISIDAAAPRCSGEARLLIFTSSACATCQRVTTVGLHSANSNPLM